MNMDQSFRQLLNETQNAEKDFPEEIKEAQQPGKGPDKGPEMKGKDPQLDNVNEEAEERKAEELGEEGGILSIEEMKKALLDFVRGCEDDRIEDMYTIFISGESAEEETEEVAADEEELPIGEPGEDEV